MARFTSLEFLEALGLDYGDYNGAKILLRLLEKKGIAKEVGKISPTGRGRKMVVYELPEEITLGVKPPDSVPSHPVRQKKSEEDKIRRIADKIREIGLDKVLQAVSSETSSATVEISQEDDVVDNFEEDEIEEDQEEEVGVESDDDYEYDDGFDDE